MSLVYDLIFFIFALFSIPKFLVRLNQADDAKQLSRQRWGLFGPDELAKFSGKKILWLHAVSVGEVNAAREWIQLFLREYSEWTVALSTTTPTGQLLAASLASNRIIVFYAPFDLSFVVKRTLDAINPKVIILMETEIWPNLIRRAHRSGIPIGIINGRISPRSFGRYQFISPLLRPILGKLSFCLVQTDRDYNYFKQLGMPFEKIVSTGNMKFDLNGQSMSETCSRPKGFAAEDLIYVGGSTHWDEEIVLLSVFRRLKMTFQNLKLILAPRHPERLPKVEDAIKQSGFSYRLFSETGVHSNPYDVLLVDRMGVLASLYQIADVVFVGGSFAKRGGQNPIEAARFKKPILHGPNVSNFYEVYRVLDEQNAAVLTVSEDELYQQSKKLLERPELRTEMGVQAQTCIQSMKGATAKTLDYLSREVLRSRSAVALA